jgi:hypothetical protein
MVFGTDGGAGAHGRNFEELVYRVRDGGQPPMAAGSRRVRVDRSTPRAWCWA